MNVKELKKRLESYPDDAVVYRKPLPVRCPEEGLDSPMNLEELMNVSYRTKVEVNGLDIEIEKEVIL